MSPLVWTFTRFSTATTCIPSITTFVTQLFQIGHKIFCFHIIRNFVLNAVYENVLYLFKIRVHTHGMDDAGDMVYFNVWRKVCTVLITSWLDKFLLSNCVHSIVEWASMMGLMQYHDPFLWNDYLACCISNLTEFVLNSLSVYFVSVTLVLILKAPMVFRLSWKKAM